MTTIYDFSVKTIDGAEQPLSEYRGQTLLVVNVASRCGFTPQYTGLEAIYRRHHDEGFSVLGFPCDQFLHQEPGDESEIKNFCSLKYDVTFALFAKVKVNGPQAAPVYKYLKSARRGVFWTQAIKWNFTKFLIDRAGNVLRRYAPRVTPEQIEADVKQALASGG